MTIRILSITLALIGSMSSSLLPIRSAGQTTLAATITTLIDKPAARAVANGKIAFVSSVKGDSAIFTANPDGSDPMRLTEAHNDSAPAWSPDGTQIVFVRRNGSDKAAEIFVMNADGSNQTRLTQSRDDRYPTWSPDGMKIAFSRYESGNDYGNAVYVINADGSGQRIIAKGCSQPAWSPDGSTLAVSLDFGFGMEIIRIDGGNPTSLPGSGDYSQSPVWSPDGSKIAFTSLHDCDIFDNCSLSIATVNADGSNPVRLSDTTGQNPNWSPDGTKIVFDDGIGLFVMNADGSNITKLSGIANGLQLDASWQPLLTPGCAESISATSQSFDAGGGTSSVEVTAGSECGWAAATYAGWISVGSNGIGNGNGSVSYSVAPNDSTSSRVGVLFVANRTLIVTQARALTRITATSVAGKKLFVVGEHFDPDAVILINGEAQKTANDDQSPKSTLIAKKAGKKIQPGDKLQVRNPNGTMSQEFTFAGSQGPG